MSWFILGLISNLIASFQAHLALLILHADYSRRRQNIIRLLSLPVSRGIRIHDAYYSTVWRLRGVKWVIVLDMALSYHSEHVCVKHAQSGKLSFSNRFIVYVCTGENDAKTLRVDANCFENEKKVAFSNEYGYVWTGPYCFLQAADWPTANFRGMYCYFPVILLVNFV